MKFVCDKCRTKYTIADEKVHGKVLKIRCKNCGNIIEVREPTAGPAGAARPAQKPSTQGALKAMSRHGGTRKRSSAVAKIGPAGVTSRPTSPSKSSPSLGARADRVRPTPAATPRAGPDRAAPAGLTKRPPSTTPRRPAVPDHDNEPKTVVAAMPQEMLRELRRGGPASAAPAAATAKDDGGWFLGDDRGEYGPMTFAELAARCQRGEPGPNAEAWKEGFGDWLPLEEIPQLKPYLKVAPPPRPVAGAKPAPASPYTKVPHLDAAVAAPPPPPKAPLPAKVTPAAPVDDSLVKIPRAAPVLPTEDGWPELPPIQPAAPTPAPLTAAAALAPEPFLPANVLGTPAVPTAAASAHVSAGTGQASFDSQLVELKRDRRPTLFIGAGVLLLSISVVVLVVYLISSSRKPAREGDKTTTAEAGMTMAPMRAATTMPLPMDAMPAPMAPMDVDDSAELDLDIDVSTGMVSKRRRRHRKISGMKPEDPMETMSAASSGSLYGLPTMRAGFVGLMGFGSPSSSAGSAPTSGSRPGNLGSVVRRHHNRLKRCYEKAARLNTRIRNPRLRITIKVQASGRTRSVYVSPARFQSDTLGICVRRTIMSWRWPSHGSDYHYTFSARFHSG
jgi:predicted Zn finger-like uncharacterized protein